MYQAEKVSNSVPDMKTFGRTVTFSNEMQNILNLG